MRGAKASHPSLKNENLDGPNKEDNKMTTKSTPFKSLLIANRGEIACRIIRTASLMGIRTVAIYSEADAEAPHVAMADDARLIGPSPVSESYLVGDKVLDIARTTGAEAIHPGYGFLSENAGFAKACTDAGIIFVGPNADAINLMGDKAKAKRRMIDAGVPCTMRITYQMQLRRHAAKQ